MDDALSRTNKTIEEFHAKLTRHEQELIDELDRVRSVLDAISGNVVKKPAVADGYDVIDDIVPLVRDSAQPLPQSEILERLKRTVMEKLHYNEKDAQANIYRSLWYHTRKSVGTKDDRGLRAVEATEDGKYKVAAFKTKGARRKYPENLIWHVDRLKPS